MTLGPAARLRRTVETYTEAVRGVRSLNFEYREDEDAATFPPKLELLRLDAWLVTVHHWGTMLLRWTPEAALSSGVADALDWLDALDAPSRAARIVANARRDGPSSVEEATRALAAELNLWIDVASVMPEIDDVHAAARADPAPLNRLGTTSDAI